MAEAGPTRAPRGRRNLLADGANSFWHVVFGMAAYHAKIGVLVYAAYQLYGFDDPNLLVDVLEFLIGYGAAMAHSRLLGHGSAR